MDRTVRPLSGTEGSEQQQLGASEQNCRRAADLPDLLTKKQFAEFLQVSMGTIDNRVTLGSPGYCARCPQPVDIGGSIRWHKGQVVAYVQESPRSKRRRIQ